MNGPQSEGKETQELQEVVYETSSDIYKLEKVVETNEYEIPDLWKLKVAKSQMYHHFFRVFFCRFVIWQY